MNFADGLERKSAKVRGVHLFQDRHRADQMMRRFCQRCGIRLSRQQIEPAINLERVRAHNFSAELARNVSRDLRFTGRRRTDNEEDVAHKKIGRRARLNERYVSRLKSQAALNFASTRSISRR